MSTSSLIVYVGVLLIIVVGSLIVNHMDKEVGSEQTLPIPFMVRPHTAIKQVVDHPVTATSAPGLRLLFLCHPMICITGVSPAGAPTGQK